MYVVVVYDAGPTERKLIRGTLKKQLHWIQNSVFAGKITRTAAMDIYHELEEVVEHGRVTFWMFDRKPETHLLGRQADEESMFI